MTAAAGGMVLKLRVAQARLLTPNIREFKLVAADGVPLPPFEAGSHIKVNVALPDGTRAWREYSLIDAAGSRRGDAPPTSYVIAVQAEAQGRGGSRWMHASVQVGDVLEVEAPRNAFALQPTAGTTHLLAGGIGITPLLTMAAQCIASHGPVKLHYAGRSRGLMALLPELQALLGDRLEVHADDEAGRPFDVAGLLDRCTDLVYVCGPKPLLDAVLTQAQARGWPADRVRFEVFAAPPAAAGDHAFELVLASSGRSLTVGAAQSILDVLIEAGLDPIYDCKRGECGVCAVGVVEGEIDHRDYVLSASEKSAGNVLQSCVSRCRGTRLVLDL